MSSIATRFSDFLQYGDTTLLAIMGIGILTIIIVAIRAYLIRKAHPMTHSSQIFAKAYCLFVAGVLVGVFISYTNAVTTEKAILFSEAQIILSDCAIKDICYGPERRLTVKAINDIQAMKEKGYYSNINVRHVLGLLEQITDITNQMKLDIVNEKADEILKKGKKPSSNIEI